VVETFWAKYPDESERKIQIREIYKNAKFWLRGGTGSRSYDLAPEQHKIIVGIPQSSASLSNLEELKRMLESTRLPGDPALSIQNVADSSEIVFYSEVGGIPINWADSIHELRQKYLHKQAEGEELHTDHHEIKFQDVVVLNDRERSDLEEAHECFLLGLIFGEINPERDASGRIRYLWSEAVGLRERTIALGEEPRALAELISRKTTRNILMERIRENYDKVRSDSDYLARLYALLDWYYHNIFKAKDVEGPDGVVYPEESNASRAVSKQIERIDAMVRAQENAQISTRAQFRQLSLNYANRLDEFAPKLVDGKRAFAPTTAESDSRVLRMGGR
jgi:hypothetical protein